MAILILISIFLTALYFVSKNNIYWKKRKFRHQQNDRFNVTRFTSIFTLFYQLEKTFHY